MIRLFAPLLISLQLYAVTLSEINSKPPSLAKNFLIWQYFKQDITSEQADAAFYQIRDVNRKLFFSYAKKSDRPEVAYTATCMKMKRKAVEKSTDESCIKIAFSIGQAIYMTPEDRIRMAKIVDDSTTTELIKMLNNRELSDQLETYPPKLFLRLFNSSNASFRRNNFNQLFSKQQMQKLAASRGFTRALITAMTVSYMDQYLNSLLQVDGTDLDGNSNFFLGLNQLRHGNNPKAIEHFQIAHTKAYYRMDKDKTLFWQFLASKNDLILKKLASSVDINIYSLYAKEHYKMNLDNYFITLETSSKKSRYNLQDPFVWNRLLTEIKSTPKKELYDLAQQYDAPNLVPVQSFVVERASGYKLHGFVMPYDRYMKDLSIDDKALYYALMRQESRFVPAALSRSFALGLMQIMPFLVKALDKEVKYKRHSLHDMFDPRINLLYAKTHIKWLQYRVYHPLFIAYAYNGGIGFTKRHITQKGVFRKGSYEPFMSMELMSNSESREYGKKVLSNYVIYKRILGEKVSITHLFDSLTIPSKTDRFRKKGV